MEVALVIAGVICEPSFPLLTKIDWIECPESQTGSPEVPCFVLWSLTVSYHLGQLPEPVHVVVGSPCVSCHCARQ